MIAKWALFSIEDDMAEERDGGNDEEGEGNEEEEEEDEEDADVGNWNLRSFD